VIFALAAIAAERFEVHGQAHKHTPAAAVVAGTDNNQIADAKLSEASQAAQAGKWRECANAYLEAYLRSDDEWPLRYNCLSGFASVLREKHFDTSEYDRRILRQIMEDPTVPKLHAAQAQFSLGYVSHLMGDSEGASEGYRKVLVTAEAMSLAERQTTVVLPLESGYGPVRSGEAVDSLVDYAKKNLDSMPPPVPTATHQRHTHTPQGLKDEV